MLLDHAAVSEGGQPILTHGLRPTRVASGSSCANFDVRAHLHIRASRGFMGQSGVGITRLGSRASGTSEVYGWGTGSLEESTSNCSGYPENGGFAFFREGGLLVVDTDGRGGAAACGLVSRRVASSCPLVSKSESCSLRSLVSKGTPQATDRCQGQ